MNNATNAPDRSLHMIFGTGPAACWTARALRARGVPVLAVNRSGQRPGLMPADVHILRADLMDRRQAVDVARGAAVVYQALGPAYSEWAQRFPVLQAHTVEAAQVAGARYVALENLYMMDADSTITETSRVAPSSAKGAVRLEMHERLRALHQAGDLCIVALRASDYYGPGVRTSIMGERVFSRLVAGKAAQVMGRTDQPHSLAFIADVGEAMATLGCSTDAALWGRAWLAPHAPPATQAEVIAMACRLLDQPTKLSALPGWALPLIGLFSADARASVEMQYQVLKPFVVDGQHSQRALGLTATPLIDGLTQTLAWYQAQQVALNLRSPTT